MPPDRVDDSETLHRMVPKASAGPEKPHYMAFYSSTLPWQISVDRAAYRSLDESLAQWARCGAAALNTGAVRVVPLTPAVAVNACPENGNDAHAEIVVPDTTSKSFVKTKVCVKLAELAVMVQQPPP